MFCPKCGQSQPADGLRFCSRCGFPQIGVAELLARDGVPAHPVAAAVPRALSPRRKGLREGGAIMLVGVFLTPMIAMLHPLIGLPGEYSVLGAMIFLAGLLRLIFAAIFQDDAPAVAHHVSLYAPPTAQSQFSPRAVVPPLQQGEMRPAQSLFARRQDTAEIVQQPTSVTDHTTRLLADRDDPADS